MEKPQKGVVDKRYALLTRGRRLDSLLLHKTTFGEPLGVPDIKPTQILNQPGGTGLDPGKPQKGVVDKPHAL